MKLLVVGAASSLGQAVIAEAVDRDHDVERIGARPGQLEPPAAVRKLHGDVLDPATLESAVERQDAVICALRSRFSRESESRTEFRLASRTAAVS